VTAVFSASREEAVVRVDRMRVQKEANERYSISRTGRICGFPCELSKWYASSFKKEAVLRSSSSNASPNPTGYSYPASLEFARCYNVGTMASPKRIHIKLLVNRPMNPRDSKFQVTYGDLQVG
jgi:hypothetical protein